MKNSEQKKETLRILGISEERNEQLAKATEAMFNDPEQQKQDFNMGNIINGVLKYMPEDITPIELLYVGSLAGISFQAYKDKQ